ncbi:hypothetical protein HDU97_003590 [Phlyctochytrium planicorne]|nr:hypothetical protein HDU97_003590 [Phlyctochytrium planicorne]
MKLDKTLATAKRRFRVDAVTNLVYHIKHFLAAGPTTPANLLAMLIVKTHNGHIRLHPAQYLFIHIHVFEYTDAEFLSVVRNGRDALMELGYPKNHSCWFDYLLEGDGVECVGSLTRERVEAMGKGGEERRWGFAVTPGYMHGVKVVSVEKKGREREEEEDVGKGDGSCKRVCTQESRHGLAAAKGDGNAVGEEVDSAVHVLSPRSLKGDDKIKTEVEMSCSGASTRTPMGCESGKDEGKSVVDSGRNIATDAVRGKKSVSSTEQLRPIATPTNKKSKRPSGVVWNGNSYTWKNKRFLVDPYPCTSGTPYKTWNNPYLQNLASQKEERDVRAFTPRLRVNPYRSDRGNFYHPAYTPGNAYLSDSPGLKRKASDELEEGSERWRRYRPDLVVQYLQPKFGFMSTGPPTEEEVYWGCVEAAVHQEFHVAKKQWVEKGPWGVWVQSPEELSPVASPRI